MPSSTVSVPPRPNVHSGKGESNRRAEREAMLADQVRGMRLSQLVEKYNVSAATVSRRLKQALDERMPATVDARREQLNASLDEQLAGWQANYEAGTRLAAGAVTVDPETGLEVLDTAQLERGIKIRTDALAGMARCDERRARLNGTDAPVKVEAEVTQVTPQERELRDLIEQAQREQAAREATLLEEQDVTG
jgi:transposase